MQPLTRHSVARAALAALLLLSCTAAADDRRKAEADLAAVQAEIERIREAVNRDQVERDRLSQELRSAEVSVGTARAGLERLRRERAEHTERRTLLAAEKQREEAELARDQAVLGGQLRAAYVIGREEPLRLLLNQKDPSRIGRMLAYYGYFGRARADEIARIEANVKQIETLDAQLAEEERRLAALETERLGEIRRLEQARSKRGAVLASLNQQVRTRSESLERLRRQKTGLEKLIRELKLAMEKFPAAGSAFAKLRGQLSWPVVGKIVARFGEARAGGLKWDGMLVATERGTPVRSVHSGRVVYADWLPGLGLLAIVDHGEGYLSLYGHNERLYKAAGERVTAGETLAAAGDSGGRSRSELYFEIRKSGKPVDPRPWFKASNPRPAQ